LNSCHPQIQVKQTPQIVAVARTYVSKQYTYMTHMAKMVAEQFFMVDMYLPKQYIS